MTFGSNIKVFMLSKLSCHQNGTQLELFKLVKLEFCVSELSAELVSHIHAMIRCIYFVYFNMLCFIEGIMAWEEERKPE